MKNITKVLDIEEFIMVGRRIAKYRFYQKLKCGKADKTTVITLLCLFLLLVVVAVLFALAFIIRRLQFISWGILLLCVDIFICTKIRKGVYQRIALQYEEYKKNALDIVYEFSKEHVQIEKENQEKKCIKYSSIEEILKIKNGYILCPDNEFFFVSKKGFLDVNKKEYDHYMNEVCKHLKSTERK